MLGWRPRSELNFAFIFCFTLSLTTFADAPILSTWKEILHEAYANNPNIKAAEKSVDALEATYKGTFSPFMPQLSLTGSLTQASTGVITTAGQSGGASAFGSSSTTTYTAGLNVTQSVFNGFQNIGQVRQAKANLAAAQAALDLAKATVSASLKTAWSNLILSIKSVDLSLAILKKEEADLRLVQLRFDGGQENKGNLDYQKATVSQALYQYNHAKRQVRVYAKSVLALLGRPETDNIDTKDDFQIPTPPGNTDMKAYALSHPSHLQAYYQQVAANAAVTIADQGWYPNVGVTGFVGRTGSDFFPNIPRWSVVVSVTFPIFPGTSQIFNTINALETERQTEFNTRNIDVGLIATLENAYGSLLDNIEQVKFYGEFKNAAIARSKIGTEKYNTGLMTFEDWTVIETDVITQSENLLNSQQNAMQAQATWESATGRGDEP